MATFERTFNITATAAGARLSPPSATIVALGLAAGSKLYAYRWLWIQNIGDDTVSIRTDEDATPANAGEATVTVLTLEPKQRDRIPVRHIDIEDYIDTESFFAFATINSDIVVTAD